MKQATKKPETISKFTKIDLAINEIETNNKYEANREALIRFFELKLIKLALK